MRFLLILVLLFPSVISYSQAVWGSRVYSGRVCSNPRCRMCNSISRQLRSPFSREVRSVQGRFVPVVRVHQIEQLPDFMPHKVVDELLAIAEPTKGQVLYDLGCGDGRILKRANLDYGLSVLGIEVNSRTYTKARTLMKDLFGWKLINGDATKYSLREADIVTLYLYPHVMEKIKFSTLKRGAKVVSYSHDIPTLETEARNKMIDGHSHTFFVYQN